MRLLAYGGSFNPPHWGHVKALTAAAEYLHPDRVLVIPAREPPHKQIQPGSPPPEERLRLAELAFAGVPGAEVTDMELHRTGKSFTSDTLCRLREDFPDGEIYFLMGTDMLLYMENWHDFRRIFSLCTLLVLPRNPGEEKEIARQAARLEREYGARVAVVPAGPCPAGSTDLRERLGRREGRELLPETVYQRIIRRRLYGARPELAWLRERTEEYLSPSRVPHVRGCEQEAVRLARRWGEDPGEAAQAGILHDITKKMGPAEQLRLCEKYGIITDTAEREEPRLLHARTGAYLARDLFGVTERVFGAIQWHTTGRPGMTRLEKILYLADYIEPTRDFDGVGALRRLAYEDMDRAMILGLEMSLEEIKARGGRMHRRSLDTLNWLRTKE